MPAWAVLGINLAINKGQVGPDIDWTGCTFSLRDESVVATTLASRLAEVRQLVDDVGTMDVIATQKLRTLIGKVQSLASLLFVWRPFVQMLYAAIHSPASGAPHNCVWRKQIDIPLAWIRAFLQQTQGQLIREFSLQSFLRRGLKHTITTDASPWGLGAVLEIDNQIVSCIADQIHDTDRKVLSLSDTGEARDQQVLEALALLVALREWASHWTNRRVQLSVRSDNMAALAMVCRMQPHSEQMGIVAREMALDICQSSISPDECSHIPGLANKAADALSRVYAPSPQPPLPAYLGPELRHSCALRLRTWWRALPH